MRKPLPFLLALTCLTLPAAGRTAELFVAPGGSDSNPGTREAPFATVERARDTARTLKAKEGVTVTLRAGTYPRKTAFELGAADSGTAETPIVYRAAPGETVVFSGGSAIPRFVPVTDAAVLRRLDAAARGRVLRADIRALGVTDFGDGAANRLELFFRNRPMTIARWPNAEWTTIEEMVGEPEKDGASNRWTSGKFLAPKAARERADRLERWAEEPNLKLHGYWYHDWADQRMEVGSVDPATGVIALRNPEKHSYGYRPKQRFYAYDALSELDYPGEWYVDRQAGVLYFYPPSTPAAGDAVLSTLSSPMVGIKDAAHVTLRGITFEYGRASGATVSGGSDIQIVGCTFRSLGGWGVRVGGGQRHRVAGCDITLVGAGGISLGGGNRTTLAPGGHEAVNNHIHKYAYWERVYRPGVELTGVGNRAAHNLIHDAPHMGMGFSGNDHVMELNEIHSVLLETRDAGVIYTGRNWTMRGNVLRHNFLHNIPRGWRMGIYLDDTFSSASIVGNVFYRVPAAAFIGGGRDNRVENNIFVECDPAVHVDARGMTSHRQHPDAWLKEYEEKGTLSGIAFDKPPYSERYPELATMMKGEPRAPEGVVVARNVSWRGRFDGVRQEARPYVKMENNLVDVDPKFVDVEKRNFQLRDDSPAWAIGFQRIPFDKIGLVNDGTRATWPVVHKVDPKVVEESATRKRSVATPPTVFRAGRAPAAVTIDGQVTEAEWGGAARAMTVEQGVGGGKSQPASRAWVAHDGAALLVAVEMPISAGKTLQTGSEWGKNDAVEIAVVNPIGGGQFPPTLVLRGYVSGRFESSGEAGAPAAAVNKAAEGVRYAARVVRPDLWTAEWRIPFEALGGIDLRVTGEARLPFNLTVRKTGDNLWQMWRGTTGSSWQVENSGIVELER